MEGAILVVMQPWIRHINSDGANSSDQVAGSFNLCTALTNNEDYRDDIRTRFQSFVAPKLKDVVLRNATKKFSYTPLWLAIKYVISAARHETSLKWNVEDREWELTTFFHLSVPFSKDTLKHSDVGVMESQQTSDDIWRTLWIRCTIDESGGIEVQVPQWTKMKFPKGVTRISEHYKNIISQQFKEAGFCCEERHQAPKRTHQEKYSRRGNLLSKARSSWSNLGTRSKSLSCRTSSFNTCRDFSEEHVCKQ